MDPGRGRGAFGAGVLEHLLEGPRAVALGAARAAVVVLLYPDPQHRGDPRDHLPLLYREGRLLGALQEPRVGLK